MGVHNQLLFDSQKVWVLNSTLPSLETQLLSMYGQLPLAVRDTWKKPTLPMTLTLPSESLTMAQVIPVTVRMESLISKSKYAGQSIVGMRAYFALRQDILGRANRSGGHCTTQGRMASDSRSSERTVFMTMPTTPRVALSAETK